MHSSTTDSVVLELVEREFGIRGRQARAYAGEHARNLRVSDVDGARYLIKLSKETHSSALDWHDLLLRELEQKTLHFAVPRLLDTRSGDSRVMVRLEDGPIQVRVMTWLEGDLLRDVPRYSRALLSSLGAASAELTEALSHVEPPVDLPRHHWLIEDALVSLDKELARLTLTSERLTIGRIRAFCADQLSDITSLPKTTVHQDLHDQNVLVEAAGHSRVSGVIDFDDAFYTARAADLAIAATYGMLRQPNPLECFTAVLDGYFSVSPLTQEEVEALFPMSVLRLAVNWATWSARNSNAADPSYGARRSQHTWPLIQELVNRGLERTSNEIVSGVKRRAATNTFGR